MKFRFVGFILVLAVLAGTVSAASTTISIANKNVGTNGNVVIPVQISGASGLAAADIAISYNGNLMKFVKAEPGALVKNGMVEAQERQPGNLHVNLIESKGISGDGELLLLTFAISGKKGDVSDVSIIVTTAAGTDLKDVTVQTTGGKVAFGTASGMPVSPFASITAIGIIFGVAGLRERRREQ